MLTLTHMNERIQQFLAAENISQAQLADTLGVSKASISHIISGRNKPGTDFLVSLLQHYPELNIEWILTGNGKMYRERRRMNFLPKDEALPSEDISPEAQLFDEAPETETDPVRNSVPGESQICHPSAMNYINSQNTEAMAESDKLEQTSENQRHITKIMVFFDDNTFEEIR